MAYTFGMSRIGATSGALGRRYARPLPQYNQGHPAYQAPQGATTLPQRPGMATQAPVQYSGFPYNEQLGTFGFRGPERGDYDSPAAFQTRNAVGGYVPYGMGEPLLPYYHEAQFGGRAGAAIGPIPPAPAPPDPTGMGHSVRQRSGSDLGAGGLMSVPDRPFGMTMPQPTAGGMLQNGQPRVFPGSGNVYYRDNAYNPTLNQRRQDDAGVASILSQNRAAGSGPYDSQGMNHFGPLASQPQHVQQPVPVGTVYGGRTQIYNIDGREVGLGPGVDPATYAGTPQGMAGAAGRRGVFVQTGPPAYGLSPEMEERRQAAIERQATNRDMLGANRNIRANRQDDAPLRADQFPRAQAAYGQQQAGGSYVNASPGPLGNIADRQAALDRRASGPFAQTTGFDPRETTVNGAIDQFVADSGNWSPQDQQEFVSGINERAASDPQFKKEWDAWLNRNDYDVTTHTTGLQTQDYDAAELQSINALRAMFGKPPLKPKGVDNRGSLPISAYGT